MPILVRPVREQLEHDRVIRLLLAKWKKRLDAEANVGEERRAPLKIGPMTLFPDLILTSASAPKRVQGIVEVETGESVNNLEAMAQWTHMSKAKAPFWLYVPVGAVDQARRLCAEHHVALGELWSYYVIGEQVRFTLIHREPAPGAKGKGAVADVFETETLGPLEYPPDPRTLVVEDEAEEEPAPKPTPSAEKAEKVVTAKAGKAEKAATGKAEKATPAKADSKGEPGGRAPAAAAAQPAAAPAPAPAKATTRAAAPPSSPAASKKGTVASAKASAPVSPGSVKAPVAAIKPALPAKRPTPVRTPAAAKPPAAKAAPARPAAKAPSMVRAGATKTAAVAVRKRAPAPSAPGKPAVKKGTSALGSARPATLGKPGRPVATAAARKAKPTAKPAVRSAKPAKRR